MASSRVKPKRLTTSSFVSALRVVDQEEVVYISRGRDVEEVSEDCGEKGPEPIPGIDCADCSEGHGELLEAVSLSTSRR